MAHRKALQASISASQIFEIPNKSQQAASVGNEETEVATLSVEEQRMKVIERYVHFRERCSSCVHSQFLRVWIMDLKAMNRASFASQEALNRGATKHSLDRVVRSKSEEGSHWLNAITAATLATAAAILVLFGYAGYHWRSVRGVEHAVQSLGGNYKWAFETQVAANDTWQKIYNSQAFQLATPFLSSIDSVRLTNPAMTDKDAWVLEKLQSVSSLHLASPQITDETLDSVAEMRGLNRLTLDAERLTIAGYLKLRRLPHLRSLVLDLKKLQPIELAVLSTELYSVQLFDIEAELNNKKEFSSAAKHPIPQPFAI